MSTTAATGPSVNELADSLGLPGHIVRRFIARQGLMPARRYPRQKIRLPVALIPRIRRLMRDAGYPIPEKEAP